MDERTERIELMAAAMAKVGVALLALPLAELPPIAAVSVGRELSGELPVHLQLGGLIEIAPALSAWAEALPKPRLTGKEFETYIRLEVTGVLDDVPVVVWGHLKGQALVEAGNFLSLPLGGESHRLPLAALRGLAERVGVTSHA